MPHDSIDLPPTEKPFKLLAVMGVFGFLSGLPLPLSAFTLQQWFTSSGISAAAVGTTSMLGLAYILKFLWAPLFDTMPPGALARFGRRRGWLLLVQPALGLCVLALAYSTPSITPLRTVASALGVAFFSASQDILIDSWRIEIFPEALQGEALAATIWGYRTAMLVSGGATIWASAIIGWSPVLTGLALILGSGVFITVIAPPSPHRLVLARKTLRDTMIAPLLEFLYRPGSKQILAFVLLFRLGKVFADLMAAPFYKESVGFAQKAVGIANFWPGFIGTLAGAALGGLIVRRFGTYRALVLTGSAQMASLGLYLLLMLTGPSVIALSGKVAIENLAGSAADMAFLTFISALCARDFTATQYALLSALAAVVFHTVGGASGFLAQAVGWPVFYVLTMALCLPAFVALRFIPRAQSISASRKNR